MPAAQLSEPTHRFPGWELDPLARTLYIDGQPVRIGSRAFDVLLTLIEQSGRVIGKNELIERAWRGRVVEDNNLSVQITALRKLLGPAAIVNVSGVGYRLATLPLPADAPTDAPADAPAPPPSPTAATAAMNAPALIGRDADLHALATVIGRVPLLTLVGAGGVGKTTLARALVARLADPPADGVHWIDLAPVARGTALLPLVAKALQLSARGGGEGADELARLLASRRALVVLDNCEHVLDEAAALLAPLLARAGSVTWLATSQESLRLPAETVYRLAPLPLPTAGADLREAATFGALALFGQRVRAAGGSSAWSPEELSMAAELCRQLDGLPLAIEIAAARVASLGLFAVWQQIDQRLRLRSSARWAPSRQHTLLQTYEWSYGLLSAQEQRLFRALEPFAGGFEAGLVIRQQALRSDAEADPDPWAAEEALAALVQKSLVQPATRPGAAAATQGLMLLESARDFARLKLAEHGEAQVVRQAHADAVAAWFETAHRDFEHWRDEDWRARYQPELPNVQAALGWACGLPEPGPECIARLVAALGLLENFAQLPSELVRQAVPMAAIANAPAPWRALARLELGWAHHNDGSRELGTELALSALAEFEALGDDASAYRACTRLVRMYHGRPALLHRTPEIVERLARIDAKAVPLRSRLSYEASASYLVGAPRDPERLRHLQLLAEHAGFEDLAAVCRVNLTDELMVQGRDDEVVQVARAMLARGEPLPRRRALMSHNLALSLVRLGRVQEALEPAREVLRSLPHAAFMVMDTFALAAARSGRLDEAALIAGCSAQIKQQRDLRSEPAEAEVVEQTRACLAEALPAPRLAELAKLGAQMDIDTVLRIALRA